MFKNFSIKRATFTVLFFLRSYNGTKDDSLPIYVRVTANGKRVEFSLNRQIDKKEWDKQRGCIHGYTKATKDMNTTLKLLRANSICSRYKLKMRVRNELNY